MTDGSCSPEEAREDDLAVEIENRRRMANRLGRYADARFYNALESRLRVVLKERDEAVQDKRALAEVLNEEGNRVEKMTGALATVSIRLTDAEAELLRAEEALRELAEWDKRYGRDTVHSYAHKERIHRELDEICDKARAYFAEVKP